MTHFARTRGVLALAAILAVVPLHAQKGKDKNKGDRDRAMSVNPGGKSQDRISREVRHELVMLPYYGVFDNLAYAEFRIARFHV